MIRNGLEKITAAALLAVVAACTSSKPSRVVTVTATPSSPSTAAVTSPPAGSTPAGTESLPSPPASQQTALPGTCDTLLPDSQVYDASGVDSLPGTDAFVVGKADPIIHRLAYLNCRYGVTGKGSDAVPAIEIGISLYQNPSQAADRIAATVDDYTAHGAASSTTPVAGATATILTGGTGAGYDVPTLVVASGQRTVAVSIASTAAGVAKSAPVALARLALHRTAG